MSISPYKFMSNILQSASKIVFILMAIALIILTVSKVVEAKDFVMLASMAFTYYFTKQTVDGSNNQTKIL